MSTITVPLSPSFVEIRGYLNQIGQHFSAADTPLLPEQPVSAQLQPLLTLAAQLKTHRERMLAQSQARYQALGQADLHSDQGKQLLAHAKTWLNTQLKTQDELSTIDGRGPLTFMTYDAGVRALEQEVALKINDRLLHPHDARLVDNISLGPTQRPGLYALTFNFKDETIEFAGAFVLAAENSPTVTSLTATEPLGRILLFTPLRGLEPFDNLADLDAHLQQAMDTAHGREEWIGLLPRRYQSLPAAAIWPLVLRPITDEPLFEHTYNAQRTKREQDIDWVLSLENNPGHSAARLLAELDRAVLAALADLTPRLELRARQLFDRCLRNSAPDWYRRADSEKRSTLARHLSAYNTARQALLNLWGPTTTPRLLACYQLTERLADDLDLHDLDPDLLRVDTRRAVALVGSYTQSHSLSLLALRGLHSGDDRPGSDFLTNTTLTYDGAALTPAHQALTPAYLVKLLDSVQPRLDFAAAQKDSHASPAVKAAIERMLDERLNALAYTALLQNHITEGDFQNLQALRQGVASDLSVATVALHEAQLSDLWLLRQTDAQGAVTRLLLCMPQSPRAEQFMAFDSEIACQAHILGWSQDKAMTDYLLKQIALRFHPAMRALLSGLSFKPHDQEYRKVSFNIALDHATGLRLIAEHRLSTQADDYSFGSPLWYRSASAAQRKKLTSLAEDAQGALTSYTANAQSEAQFPTFKTYLHQQARLRLNQLLGRRENDVDPDTLWAHYPQAFAGLRTPSSVTYTQLVRDGYADGIGFLDPKFETSATFSGPAGIDLSPLTAENVARSVRGVWIGQRYANEVKTTLQNSSSPGYVLRRDATLAIHQLQMQNAALESRLQGHISQADLDGFEQSIPNLWDASPSVRERYQFHRLFIDGDWIIDCFLFRQGNDPVLLYTPNAPDGVSFREAKLFNYLLKKVDGMLEYFSTRAPVQSQTRVRGFLDNAKKQLPADINRTSPSTPRYDPISRETVVLDIRQALYDAKLQRKIDDVEATTTGRGQMIMGLVWSCIEPLVAIATAPYPILSLSLGLLLAFKDGMLALHAYQQGDSDAALGHFIGYLLNSAGTLFTDLRPELKVLTPLRKPARQLRHTPQETRAMTLIKQLETPQPSLSQMQSVLFDGQLLWAPQTPDALGRFLLFRQDPVSGQLKSTARLVNQNTEGRWVRSGVRGGAPKYEIRPSVDSPLKKYEMPPALSRDLEAILDPDCIPDLLARTGDLFGEQPAITNVRESMRHLHTPYRTAVAALSEDADFFFRQLDPITPRADVITFEAGALHEHIIENLLKETKGLVIGANVDSIASKHWLIDNMPTLYAKGVRRLYIEYLPADVFRAKLEKLKTAKTTWHIEQHLNKVDKALGASEDAAYSYRTLMLEARKHNIEIRALDASTSYDLDDALEAGLNSPLTPRPQPMRNFYSHKVIEADVAAHPDDGWVALMDQRRMSTYNKTPGIADLEKVVSLRIEDVRPGSPAGIWHDVPGSIPGDTLAKADFKLTLETAYQPRPASAATALPPPPKLSEFDLPDSHRALFQNALLKPGRTRDLFDTDYSNSPAAFWQTQLALKRTAKDYFTTYKTQPKATLPPLTATHSFNDFVDGAYQAADGLVIGADYTSIAGKQLLGTNMRTFAQKHVKTLYLEHLLTDFHQADLDLLFRTQHMPGALKTYLESLDKRFGLGRHEGFTYIVGKAAKHGLRIQALDCAASHRVSRAWHSRSSMMNYFAAKRILDDQAAHGPHRWVAFMGRTHTDTVDDWSPTENLAGVARLTQVPSLHVEDVPFTQAKPLHRDPGTHYQGFMQVDQHRTWDFFVQGDFKLDVAVPVRPTPPDLAIHRSPVALPIEQRLKRPGEFLIERPNSSQIQIRHRSRSGELVTTEVQVDASGQYFIERESWAPVSGRRMDSIGQLALVLSDEVNLTRVR